jgi:TATA-box binding protein (TBP) (component of TFIID and TFIIIB)
MTSNYDLYESSFINNIWQDAKETGSEPAPKRGRGAKTRVRGRGGRGRGRGTRGHRKSALDAENSDDTGVADNTVVDEDENYTGLPDVMYDINKEASTALEEGDEMATSRLSRTDNPDRTIYDVRGKNLIEWAEKIADDDELNIDPADLAPDDIEAESIITINNVVAVAETGSHFNCEWIAARGTIHGLHYNPKKFAALVVGYQNPTATAMIFPTGIVTVLGTNELTSAMRTINHVMSVIRELRDDYGNCIYERLHAQTIALSNMVASLFLFFKIDLNKLLHLPFVRYEDNEFIGCILDIGKIEPKFARRRVKLLAFATGAVVITGTKSRSEVYQVYKAAFPHLAKCALVDAAGNVVRVSREEQLYKHAELRRALLLPPDSKEIIRLNIARQIEMFERMHIGKIDSSTLLSMPRTLDLVSTDTTSRFLVKHAGAGGSMIVAKKVARKRGNAESGPQSTLGQNVIAISTIGAHNEKQVTESERRDELRKNIRAALLRETGRAPSEVQMQAAEKRATAPKKTKMLPDDEAYVLAEETEET